VTDCIDVKQVDPEDGRCGYPYRKYPAIKVARLATSKKHQGNGIGSRMLHEILTLTIMISEYVGCRIITVDAKSESVGFYERFGFKRVKSSVPIRSQCIWTTIGHLRKSICQGERTRGVDILHGAAVPRDEE